MQTGELEDRIKIVQLNYLLEQEKGYDLFISLKNKFKCEKNKDVEQFICDENKAVRFEKSSAARTYLILDKKTGDFLAYFSLSFREMVIDDKHEDITKSTIKKLNGFNTIITNIQIYLIGQIGKNCSIVDNFITLDLILKNIYGIISTVQKYIGGRAIFLECEDNEKIISLYEKYGFKKIHVISSNNNLITMYIVIK